MVAVSLVFATVPMSPHHSSSEPVPVRNCWNARRAGIGVDLVRRLGRQSVDDVLDRAHPGWIVDAAASCSRRTSSSSRRDIWRRPSRGSPEIELEPAPRLRLVEEAVDLLAVDLLALEELGDLLDLLPGLRRAPVLKPALSFQSAHCLARSGRRRRRCVVHRVAVAVDGDAMDLAVPRADRRLQIVDDSRQSRSAS